MVRPGKKATHERARIEGGLPGPSRLQGPVPEPNSASRNGQLNSGSPFKQTRRNSLGRDVCSPVEEHDLVPSLSHNIKSQTHSKVPECDGRHSVQVKPRAVNRMVTASAGVQQFCQMWFTPQVDLFTTHLNHNLPLYVSPVPDPNAWDIDALNINWTALTAYVYPPTALLHRVIQNQAMPLPDHRNSPRLARDALVLGPSAAPNRDPTATPGVNNFSQTVPQSSQPPCMVSRSGRLQEQGFSEGGRENCCPSEVINKDHLQVQVDSISEMVQRKFCGFLHFICETNLRCFHVPVPRSKHAPLDHRWLQDGHC